MVFLTPNLSSSVKALLGGIAMRISRRIAGVKRVINNLEIESGGD